MRRIREVLRLKWEKGLSNRAVARALVIGVGTVSEYVSRAQAAGLAWPLAEELDDAGLEGVLYPRPTDPRTPRPVPDFAYLHQELRRPGVTRQLLWVEYVATHPTGYRYSQFCELYDRWAERLNLSMRQVHKAGEKVFVDFSGQRPSLVHPRTGEIVEVELFVGVLGASNYVFGLATPDQSLPAWVEAHIRMIEFFGGSPAIWTPDNLKSGVTTPCRYEPEVNRTYAELASHYGAVVIPARSGRPKDKAKCEVSVQIAQRWILAPLRNQTFFSLPDLNAAIRDRVREINDRPMKKLGTSRRELFDRLDRPLLKPFPSARFEMGEWKPCRVNIDYHIEYDHNVYSVPYQLFGESVEARATATTVEVFCKSRRVASHARLFGRGQVSTVPEHMPSAHRAHAEWTPSRLIRWADTTGPATGRVVSTILANRPHPEQGFRSCLGILRLGKTYGPERLEAACVRAERLGAESYKSVKNILAAGVDRQPLDEQTSLQSSPRHDNIRGAAYYKEECPC